MRSRRTISRRSATRTSKRAAGRGGRRRSCRSSRRRRSRRCCATTTCSRMRSSRPTARGRSPAWRTGSRTRGRTSRRCSSTTTARPSTTSFRLNRNRHGWHCMRSSTSDTKKGSYPFSAKKGYDPFFAAALVVVALSAGVSAAVKINGAGATFPYPIYSKWFSEYNKLHPDVEINYQSIGSGGGIRQIQAQTVFFGATDGPMTPDQLQASPSKILHFPTVLGAVVPVYNIPGVSAELKFTGMVLGDIFLGKITKWNDAAIAKLNPGVNLPGTAITVVHRSDASGTSYIWVDYLSKVSLEFKMKVDIATAVTWPTGVGGKGNDASAGLFT